MIQELQLKITEQDLRARFLAFQFQHFQTEQFAANWPIHLHFDAVIH